MIIDKDLLTECITECTAVLDASLDTRIRYSVHSAITALLYNIAAALYLIYAVVYYFNLKKFPDHFGSMILVALALFVLLRLIIKGVTRMTDEAINKEMNSRVYIMLSNYHEEFDSMSLDEREKLIMAYINAMDIKYKNFI